MSELFQPIVLTIYGKPVPAARPRFLPGSTYCYDPKGKDKQAARKQIAGIWLGRPMLKPPIAIELEFHMPIPQSMSKKQRLLFPNKPHIRKPDVDNLTKQTLDILTGIVYEDDAGIYYLKAQKLYGDEPKTVIRFL
jgi:Holliday junction resolvase RusA-like endonuclease